MSNSDEGSRGRLIGRAIGGAISVTLLLLLLIGAAVWFAATSGTDFEPALGALVVIASLAIAAGYFIARPPTLSGFLTRWRELLAALFPAAQNEDDLLRDTRRTRDAFLAIATLGIVAMFIYALQWKPVGFARVFGGAVLTALASLTVGLCLGFLFGIPRSLQQDRPAATPGSTADAAAATHEHPATAPHLGVNTNLEQISDWLTKIIVGLGLINLDKLPHKILILMGFIAPAVGGLPSVALAIVGGYVICGFMFGYLLTRLYLARAFSRAEQLPLLITNELDAVGAVTAARPTAMAVGGETDPVSPDQRAAAVKIARVAQNADTSQIRAQVEALAREYEAIRSALPSGDERTRLMEVVASKMRALAVAAYGLLSTLKTSSSPGQRLAAVTFLEVSPDEASIPWLEARIREEVPFIAYHAAWALRHAARTLSMEKIDAVNMAILNAMESPIVQGDRGVRITLEAALKEIEKRRAPS